MPNYGQRVIVVKTPGGQLLSMKNHVVPCAGPLTSVARLVDNDHFVGFHPQGAFIYNLKTKAIEKLERVNDCYELELEIVPYEDAKPLLDASGF